MSFLEPLQPAPRHPQARDALRHWQDFALHPLRMRVPAVWQPLLANWKPDAARIRFETLTATPLELNWMWLPDQGKTSREDAARRLEAAWNREAESAENQAKKQKLAFAWQGERQSVERFAGLSGEGFARPYEWGGRLGCLAVFRLSAKGRVAYVSAAFCPPALPDPESQGELPPARIARRVLASMTLAGEGDALEVALPGAKAVLPGEYRIDDFSAGQGKLLLHARAKAKRLSISCEGLADLRLHKQEPGRVLEALARTLFDRSESPDPLFGSLITMGRTERRAQEGGAAGIATELADHQGMVFHEKRRFHIRFGDWLLRKLGRRWSGGAAALTWICPHARAIWAVSARCGLADHEAEARRILETARCHPASGEGLLDWRPFLDAETREPKQAPKPAAKDHGKPEAVQDPAILRRRQLRFRIRITPDVRIEPGKDGSADLVYQGAPADGLLARMLRGRSAPQPSFRRLTLDPAGRRVWEIIAEGKRKGVAVGELLAELSGAFRVPPVLMFPQILAFMRMLGERRLVTGVEDEPAKARVSESAPAQTN